METTKINFSYAFSEPHRLCVCLPNSSHKTLFDCKKDGLTIQWSDGSAKTNPLGAYKRIKLDWKVEIKGYCDDKPMIGTKWSRIDGYIPALHYEMESEDKLINISLKAIATDLGDVVKIKTRNVDNKSRSLRVNALVRENTINTKWFDFDCEYSVVNPIFGDASNRIVIMDAEKTTTIPSTRESVTYDLTLEAKEEVVKYLIRPNKKYSEDIDELMAVDWEEKIQAGLKAWTDLVKDASQFSLPDYQIENAYKAGFCDIFVMREEMADGRMAGMPGTEMYRSANTGEPAFQAITLSKYGYFDDAKENIEFISQFQLENGSWEDDRQWGKYMWSSSAWKSQATKEYYIRSKDKALLEENFKRMYKASSWSKEQRNKTRKKHEPNHPNYGLMPRGMGDCGLKDGDDLFGVFYPHNFLHYMGLAVNAWTAKELGLKDKYEELLADSEEYKKNLINSLEIGHIKDEDNIWIGSAAHNRAGSRWGVADVAYPSNVLDPNHPLVSGTMKKLQSNISEGGLPKNLGWIPDGLWVAIALDSMAYVNILRGDADIPAGFLVAALNHGTPLLTWSEERTEEKGSTRITGDLQHAWTPISITQFVRDMLVADSVFKDDFIHLTCAVPRYFYNNKQQISVKQAVTTDGKLSFSIERKDNTLFFKGDLKDFNKEKGLKWHIRIEEKDKLLLVKSIKGGKASIDKDIVTLTGLQDKVEIEIEIG